MRILMILAIAVVALCQQAAAPAEVEQALRERATKFLQAHVDGKFRAAEELVGEESKEEFFVAAKPRYFSFEIAKIEWSDQFTRANVSAFCEVEKNMMGMMKARVKIPRVTIWKLVNGTWFLYIPPPGTEETPFGIIKPGSAGPDTSLAAAMAQVAKPPENIKTVLKADKSEIELSATSASSETVTFENHMNGTVTLETQVPEIAGLTATPKRIDVAPEKTAIVTFQYAPPDPAQPPKSPAVAYLVVLPINARHPVAIKFTPGLKAPESKPEPAAAKPAPKSRRTKPK